MRWGDGGLGLTVYWLDIERGRLGAAGGAGLFCRMD